MNEIEITTKIVDTASLPPLPDLHPTSFFKYLDVLVNFNISNFNSTD